MNSYFVDVIYIMRVGVNMFFPTQRLKGKGKSIPTEEFEINTYTNISLQSQPRKLIFCFFIIYGLAEFDELLAKRLKKMHKFLPADLTKRVGRFFFDLYEIYTL